ncbi:Beta-hexosaminidase [Polaribacter huanghezhanensis]|uniref:family 20 glycosylhydrolase n=1 Tax=Polaribacter huanghezhanensis TaxID=1354726 RepID=UPI002648AFF2|nr:family 20 glycosylhydrolase [Polaribacter huanghezhanensis]WKD87024.1 Beta-hexosaminidase [Polaribacter huanghezhanensis]
MWNFKRIKFFFICSCIVLFFNSCTDEKQLAVIPAIIPVPSSQQINDGIFEMSNSTGIFSDDEFKQVADFLKSYIEYGSDIKLKSEASKNVISFKKDTSITNEEGYHLKIASNEITIAASSAKGAFYAIQTLRQLLPASFENGAYKESTVSIQNLEITDAPQFKYRGMHLDVGRHFFPVDFIKKYIDLMSMLKMNTFHWHLTEDQGWRIEIKKYPKLQEVAAYRNETLIGHYSDQPHKFDGKRYGGFYTQEQIKEVVKYASERQVTIIPEIEMPGHAQAAIAAYLELGCTGKPIDVATKWGVFEDIYCPKEATFKFLEDVIDEVVALFPGKYIHIGGDEAPKTRWKNCAHCQALIKKEGLKDEHGLQSYFITRMEKYINSKGKQIIGWDEILEGGLAPNATVMSWRGMKGAVTAAQQHHDVILTPGAYCYFDHYQSTKEDEPLAIGGFLPLEKVYSFNPIPKELTKKEAKYVLGAQGNVWTEYMKDSKQVEYMAFPRMVALSEVVWSENKNKNFENFKNRLEFYQQRLDARDVNYANHLYEVKGKSEIKEGVLFMDLKTSSNTKSIRYTLDGTAPNINSAVYKNSLLVDKSVTIHAASFDSKKQVSGVFKESIKMHKAVGKKITFDVAPSEKYNAGGNAALINGISGSDKRYGDNEWLGFDGKDVEITIDLGKEMDVNSIATRFNNQTGSWIYAPSQVIVSFPGNDEFIPIELEQSKEKIVDLKLETKIVTRYIKLKLINYGVIPDGKQGAGHKSWLFIDEIIVE